MMAKCFIPLPRILEENESSGEVMATKQKIPQIQRVYWTNNKVSQEWLKRMSSIKTSVFAIKPGISLIDSIDTQVTKPRPKHWNIRHCGQESLDNLGKQSILEGFAGSSDGQLRLNHSLSANSPIAEETSRRKPDSTYIGLINGITMTPDTDQKLYTQSNRDGNDNHIVIHVQGLDEKENIKTDIN